MLFGQINYVAHIKSEVEVQLGYLPLNRMNEL
jgi:hypothetical protein